MRFMTKGQHLGLLVDYCKERACRAGKIINHNTYYDMDWSLPEKRTIKFRLRWLDVITGGLHRQTCIVSGTKIFVGHADEGDEGWHWSEWDDEIAAEMLENTVRQDHPKAIIKEEA